MMTRSMMLSVGGCVSVVTGGCGYRLTWAGHGYKTRSISILDPHTLETDQHVTYRIDRASTERLSARELRDKM